MISTLIKTLTASGSDYLDFVDGTASVVFDDTYAEYMFVCTDINPATDNTDFSFQVNATDDAGGGYDTSVITSSAFVASHDEGDTEVNSVEYDTGGDLAQSASFQVLCRDCGNGADESGAYVLNIFNPSSTTFDKHFYATAHYMHHSSWARSQYTAGYINDTTPIDEIRFKFSSGAFDGVIQMYGIA